MGEAGVEERNEGRDESLGTIEGLGVAPALSTVLASLAPVYS